MSLSQRPYPDYYTLEYRDFYTCHRRLMKGFYIYAQLSGTSHVYMLVTCNSICMLVILNAFVIKNCIFVCVVISFSKTDIKCINMSSRVSI